MSSNIFKNCTLIGLLLTLTFSPTKPACLTAEQLLFLGFTKAEAEVTSDSEICKTALSGNMACVDPGDIKKIIETKLEEMKITLQKQIDLAIDNFWNIMGRWNRLYGKILEYKANNKWTVKHVIINQNMLDRANFTNLKYNKVKGFPSG